MFDTFINLIKDTYPNNTDDENTRKVKLHALKRYLVIMKFLVELMPEYTNV